MRREHAGIEIVAAAWRETDIEADGLAAIEVGDRLGSGGGLREQHSGRGDTYRQPLDRHGGLRLFWCPYTTGSLPPECDLSAGIPQPPKSPLCDGDHIAPAPLAIHGRPRMGATRP